MKLTKINRNKGFTLVELLVVIAIIAALAAMATPVIMKQKKKADMITAVSNAKQVFLLMIEFDDDFGAFPNEQTASSDVDLNGYTGKSNDYLGQFLAGGYVQSEEIFYAKGGSSTKGVKPDNNFETKSDTLRAGECGFAYVVNLSSSDNAGLPLLMAPMVDSTKFDSDPFGGKGVVLRVDGSARGERLSKQDKIKVAGKTLFTSEIWTNALSKASASGNEAPKVVEAK